MLQSNDSNVSLFKSDIQWSINSGEFLGQYSIERMNPEQQKYQAKAEGANYL